MKKTMIATFLILSITCATAAEFTKFSKSFIKNFEDCDAYSETSTSEFEGTTFTSQRSIIGWRNGVCRYQEVIKSSTESYQISCNFTSAQLDELYEAMKDKKKEPRKYELETFVEQTDKNGKTKYISAGTRTIKGNLAYITWAKYENNPYFCTYKKLK